MTNLQRFCATCGARLRPSGRFCGACGSPVVDRPGPAEAPLTPIVQTPASPPPQPAPAPEASTPAEQWPSMLPEPGPQAAPPPVPPFGPEPAWPAAASAYAPPPPARQSRSKAPCIVGGCLAALVVLALGCWALYAVLANLLPTYLVKP